MSDTVDPGHDARRLYETVREQLKGDVEQGRYPRGSLLPSVREITEQWEVSTTTARRALSELVTAGYAHAEGTRGHVSTGGPDRNDQGRTPRPETHQPAGKPSRHVEHWETVQVTALPTGWVNVFTVEGGGEMRASCPAVLLQEHRATDEYWDIHSPDGGHEVRMRTIRKEPPYGTRTVFANFNRAVLAPANEASDYTYTERPDAHQTDD